MHNWRAALPFFATEWIFEFRVHTASIYNCRTGEFLQYVFFIYSSCIVSYIVLGVGEFG